MSCAVPKPPTITAAASSAKTSTASATVIRRPGVPLGSSSHIAVTATTPSTAKSTSACAPMTSSSSRLTASTAWSAG